MLRKSVGMLFYCMAVGCTPGAVADGQDASAAGCGKDTDCKGERICVAGACRDPEPRDLGEAPMVDAASGVDGSALDLAAPVPDLGPQLSPAGWPCDPLAMAAPACALPSLLPPDGEDPAAFCSVDGLCCQRYSARASANRPARECVTCGAGWSCTNKPPLPVGWACPHAGVAECVAAFDAPDGGLNAGAICDGYGHCGDGGAVCAQAYVFPANTDGGVFFLRTVCRNCGSGFECMPCVASGMPAPASQDCCSYSMDNGVCVSRLGQPCAKQGDCGNGRIGPLACTNGICCSSTCQIAQDCCSGVCVNNVCK